MTISFSAYAKTYHKNCFREHIQESIGINRERKPFYSELTNGESDRIFNFLIGSEVVTLGIAAVYDLRASKYQKQGMSLFCHEFMGMNRTPDFDPDNRQIPAEDVKPFDWNFYKKRMAQGIASRNATATRLAALSALKELKQYPNYYCMTRHMIESIYRFAHFQPLRALEAKELKINPPNELMFDAMKLHLLGIVGSYTIDMWSIPIQESGIPILCSEIPDLLEDLKNPELESLSRE